MHAKVDERKIKNSGGNGYGLRLLNGISLDRTNVNGHDNDKENGLNHGYNDNGTAYLRSHS